MEHYGTDAKKDDKTARELMNSPVKDISAFATLEQAAQMMKETDFSQLPVTKNDQMNEGKITESKIMDAGEPDLEVVEVMESPFMEVKEKSKEGTVREILKDEPAVLVKSQNEYRGIITETDLI